MSVGYVPGTGPLRRAHPFTALALALSLAILAFALPAPVGTALLGVLVLALPLIERVPGVLVPAALTLLPFWVFLFVIHGIFRGAPLTALTIASRVTTLVVAFLTTLAVV